MRHWLLPLVLVLTFVREAYEPRLSVSSGIQVGIVDVAIVAAVVVALPGLRRAVGGSRVLYALLAAFLAYLLLDTVFASAAGYATRTHLVTWGKFAEWASIAVAVPVLASAPARVRLAWTAVALAAAAALVAVVQFAGVDIFDSWGRFNRQPAFTGVHELGALGAAVLALAFAASLVPRAFDARIVAPALVTGAACLVLSGAVAGGIGAAGAFAVLLLVRRHSLPPRRAIAAMAAALVVAEAGVLVMRGGDIAQFGRYVGIAAKEQSTTSDVQTYAQRSLLVYIGLRVWRDHPLFGAGWSSIREPSVFEPELPAAHARFPDQPPLAFPSRTHPWGIDNAYVQSLAELGAVGLALLLAFLATAAVTGVRRGASSEAALVGLGWVAVAAGVWIGQGLSIAPFTALAWFGTGLIACEAAHD